MINKASANPVTGIKDKISKAELKERIEGKLITRGISDPTLATDEQLYQATVQTMQENALEAPKRIMRT